MRLGICLPHYGRPIEIGTHARGRAAAPRTAARLVWVTDHVIVPEQANGHLSRAHRSIPSRCSRGFAG